MNGKVRYDVSGLPERLGSPAQNRTWNGPMDRCDYELGLAFDGGSGRVPRQLLMTILPLVVQQFTNHIDTKDRLSIVAGSDGPALLRRITAREFHSYRLCTGDQ